MRKIVQLGMPTLMEYSTVKENIILAKELQLDFVELNINMLYCYPTPEFRYEMLRYKDNYQINFSMHYYDTVDVSSPNRNYQNYLFKDMHEIGYTLNGIINRLVMHIEPGAYMTIYSEKEYVYKFDQDYVYRTIDNLKKIRDILETYDIELVLENVPIHPFMEKLYEALGENHFSFCWDIGHDVIYNYFLFSSWREKFNLKVKHMHMHNVLYGTKDHQMITLGDLQIDEYLKYAIIHDVNIVVEVKDIYNLKESIAYIRDFENQIVVNEELSATILKPKINSLNKNQV